jgi:hypothetical protein
MSYEEDMHIDENALDVEFLEQPTKVIKYARLLAEARRDRDLAKEALDLTKAEINLDIRDNPEKYNLTKITVDAVEACILMEDRYEQVVKEYNDANYEVNVLQGAVNALEHRKSALENLVKLYGQQYFAGPKIPHDLTELREQKTDERSHRIGQAIMKRSKTPKK